MRVQVDFRSVTTCSLLLLTITVIVSILTQVTSGLPASKQDLHRNEVINYVSNEHLLSLRYWERLYPISKVSDALRTPSDGETTAQLSCVACRIVAKSIQYLLHMGMGKEAIAKVARGLCKRFHFGTERVCYGLANVYKDEVVSVFTTVSVNPSDICSSILYTDCGSQFDPKYNWTVNLPPTPKPPVLPVQPPKPGSSVLKVLQISDIHYDPEYAEGYSAECGEPLCCRSSGAPSSDSRVAAGPWGDYRKCDTPWRTLENLFSHINSSHKVDLILWTGDDPPHNDWSPSREGHTGILQNVTDLIRKSFPNVPVFPALGNHEGIPVNSFPLSSMSTSMDWLYELLTKTWTTWLPNDTVNTIRKGGFYSVPIFPGFRIISLNMNFCNNLNWWLLLNMTDPMGELQWLILELEMAEQKGEKVHIIGHIPPGYSDCLMAWSWNYYRIVNRFESTIRGQFFGHTHLDSFEVFYDLLETPRRPVNVAYIGPSITPYTQLNPAYRIYTVDGNYAQSTWAVLDHETHFMNLSDANRSGKPVWSKVYGAKETYGMSALQPPDWDNLVKELTRNVTAFQQFYSYYHRGCEDYPSCNVECKQKIICELQSARSHDPSLCVL